MIEATAMKLSGIKILGVSSLVFIADVDQLKLYMPYKSLLLFVLKK